MSTSLPGAGPRAAGVKTQVPAPRPALTRTRECLVSGTASGLGRHLGVRALWIRALFLVLTAFGGAGVLLYAWCWAFMPWEPGTATPSRRVPMAWLLLAASVLLAVIPLRGTSDTFSTVVTLTLVVLTLVIAAVWADAIDRNDPARGPRHANIVRGIVVLALCYLAFATLVRPWGALYVVPALGLIAVFSTSLIGRWRELGAERVRRIREEQRSEIAAHLHDSVLQTLALIQNRTGASTEAARLARAQERELRAWLYDGDAPADSDLATDLRDYAAALELDYPVRMDVVAAGLSTERASGELAAAAREAMLNAARHAAGDVSVYIEGGATSVNVYVRDRGPGFTLDEVPGDRLGVRESIIGRMRRAGGSATVRSDDGGTEVHLKIVGGEG